MLRGFRDRWEVPVANVQKALDRGVELIENTISYLGEVRELTMKTSRLVDKLEELAEKENDVKKLEAEKLKLEIKALRSQVGTGKGSSR